ncbi:MAG: chorismate-binding protein, partial [Bdellovibrionaceae bacterium]|nr:chorismate-binding protein [Pseudobdellovibrionaceae bacterium]
MKRQDIITQSDFSQFLSSGAFLRWGDSWILFKGPFWLLGDNEKSEFSLSVPEFFAVEHGKFLRPTEVFHLDSGTLGRLALQFYESQKTQSPAHQWLEPSFEEFSNIFSAIKKLISQGQIDKAVPVVSSRSPARVNFQERAGILLNLLKAPPALHPFGFWDDGEGILGASPELLCEVQGLSVSTMALAGTLPKGGEGSAESLLRDPKERHEHQLVVSDIVSRLEALGHIRVMDTRVLDLPTLWHLVTDIQVRLFERPEFRKLVQILHPTAALG